MKTLLKMKQLSTFIIIASLWLPTLGQAANVLIAQQPLVNMGTSDVLPNIMFVLDNSGSMGRTFTPDWAGSSDNTLFRNSAYNTQYYNPNIVYTPAVTFNGTSMGNQPASGLLVENDVTETGAAKGGTTSLVGNAEYYAFVPGEFCTTQALDNCIISNVATTTHKFAAPLRWCNSASAATLQVPAMPPAIGSVTPPPANTCRSIREAGFTNLRTPSSKSTITVASGTTSTSFSGITVNSKQILSAASTGSTTASAVATSIAARINACTAALSGTCTTIGFSATVGTGALSNVVTIISKWGDASVPFVPVITKATGTGNLTASATAFASRTPGSMVYVPIAGAVPFVEPGKAVKAPDRKDCAGTACTLAEEMTNYANWYTYYRTRMQAMKTAASLAFKGIGNRYRVGFITIENQELGNYLPIAKYAAAAGEQKDLWYKQLYLTTPTTATPLREALSTVGRIYAGKNPVAGFTADPVEYACQQNFALLTTDGYWNGPEGVDIKNVAIGNLDGGTTPRPLKEGTTATSGSLADVAKYYYDSDIRNNAGADANKNFNNCTGTLGSDVCGTANDHLQQNMVTLTLGLGIDGTLLYTEDYKDQKVGDGDFGNLLQGGTQNWSNPMPAEDGTRIDDLWHAAVNAGGTYYSAKNPKLLRESLIKGLSEIKSVFGAGSAAAASTLSPSNGDNYQFVASYRSVKWTGNLEARTVDLTTLKTNLDAVWCAESIAGEACPTGATQVTGADINSNAFYCRTPNSNTTDCAALGGTLGGTNCDVEIITACQGTMPSRVFPAENRTIYKNGGGGLTNFTAGSLTPTENAAFVTGYNNLSQYPDFTLAQQTDTDANKVAKLVNFVRGQQGNENRTANLALDRLFRTREATLGDITQSKPAYLKASTLKYTDAGYLAFNTAGATRAATVFVGANDGMLHAFDAVNGAERWTFIPTPVVNNLPKLADRDYATGHKNYVNGDPVITDICVSGCSGAGAVWKTILVAGLNGGGRGYYALDVTNPTAPSLMWEFTAANDNDLGYSFGVPVVTKLNNGRWVVLLTSGYNNGQFDSDGVTANAPAGNGQGYLYVRDAVDGSPINKISTGAGSPSTPSGLAKIASIGVNPNKNNLSTFVYGGDLEGNLWRFNINDATTPLLKITKLIGPNGVQPITTTPEVGLINKKRVIFVGTGKYLEPADLLTTQVQSVYAIKDADLSNEITGLRAALVEQTLIAGGNTRSVNDVPVNFSTGLGWFLDFPAGERVNIDPLLVNSVLLMPTLVPSSTSCLGGGYSWFNYFNYKTGGSANIPGNLVSEKLNAPAVGFNLTYKDGKPVVSVVKSNNATSELIQQKDVAGQSSTTRNKVFNKNDGPGGDGTYGKRSIWRELIKP